MKEVKGRERESLGTKTIDFVPSTSAIVSEQVAAVNEEQKQQEGGTKDSREALQGKDEIQNKEEKQSGEQKVRTEGEKATGSSEGGRKVKDKTKGRQTNLGNGDGGERHKVEGMQASISEAGEERDVKAESDHANGGDSKTKKETEEGRQTDHLCGGDSEEKPRAEGEGKSEGGNQKKAVSPPTSVVTPPPKQPKNLKVGG